MEYHLNILGEFENKELESIFRTGEVRKGRNFVRYMILVSGLFFLLAGIPDLLYRKDAGSGLLTALVITRAVIFIIGFILFFVVKRIDSIKVINRLTYAFASLIFIVYFGAAFYFAPLEIMSPTFCVIILSTCLFMMPNRWVYNVSLSLAYCVLFLVTTPYICMTTPFGYRIVASSYLCWNIIILSVLFYNMNLYKRNYYAKAYQLEALVHTDQLTKIHNRKACDDILENKCTKNTAFSIIMFDIDNFKLINDTYGHVAGDEVLVKIAELALKHIRKDDVLARWGGEEFVIITHGATLKEAEELAKRLKEQLTLIEYHGQKHVITCSFGVTAYLTGDNVTSIIRRADQLLYLAKEYGKNRVVAG